MTAIELLAELHCRGVILVASGDHLRWRAPKGRVTPLMRSLMRQHRARLIQLVQDGSTLTLIDKLDLEPIERPAPDRASRVRALGGGWA